MATGYKALSIGTENIRITSRPTLESTHENAANTKARTAKGRRMASSEASAPPSTTYVSQK